ncbi:uncharacterized protein LOC135479726 [Liolophura sinensis]|uniref:uncharacterized protein LOC135479726 n=1 Tax=Liolophura sinensis TaxID=3198878 RepID=UPI00315926F5
MAHIEQFTDKQLQPDGPTFSPKAFIIFLSCLRKRKMKAPLFIGIFVCLVSLTSSTCMAGPESSCMEGWNVVCSRPLADFTVKKAKRFCKKMRNGQVVKGQCVIAGGLGVNTNACCTLGK